MESRTCLAPDAGGNQNPGIRLRPDSGATKERSEMKPIRLSKHALGDTASRGFTVAEVQEAIRTCRACAAELGRLDCRKNFAFGRELNGIVFAIRQVHPD